MSAPPEHFPSKQMPVGRKKMREKQEARADDLMQSGRFPLSSPRRSRVRAASAGVVTVLRLRAKRADRVAMNHGLKA
jgi:hypothetical protein